MARLLPRFYHIRQSVKTRNGVRNVSGKISCHILKMHMESIAPHIFTSILKYTGEFYHHANVQGCHALAARCDKMHRLNIGNIIGDISLFRIYKKSCYSESQIRVRVRVRIRVRINNNKPFALFGIASLITKGTLCRPGLI